jgi:tetratricopeptide (TPR) repeat protein
MRLFRVLALSLSVFSSTSALAQEPSAGTGETPSSELTRDVPEADPSKRDAPKADDASSSASANSTANPTANPTANSDSGPRKRLELKGASPNVAVIFEATDPGVRDDVNRVITELNAALNRDGRLKAVPVSTDDSAGSEAPVQEDLSEATKALDAAKASYDGLDLDGAIAQYKAAIKVYFDHPLSADPKAAGAAFLAMGAAYQLNGDQAHANASYRFALAVAPDLEPDAANYGPDIRNAFAKVKQSDEADSQQNPSTLDIDIENNVPAEITVDGKAAGTAPVHGFKVFPGRHMVVAKAQGFKPAGMGVPVSAGSSAPVKFTLEENEGHRRFAGAVQRAQANMHLASPGPGVNELAQATNARLVVVGSIASSGTGAKIDVVLFDTQPPGHRLAGLSRDTLIESSQFPAAMDDLAVELGNDFINPPEDVVADVPGSSKPVYKRWYFWAGVGVAAVAAGAAAGYYYVNQPVGMNHGVGMTLGFR